MPDPRRRIVAEILTRLDDLTGYDTEDVPLPVEALVSAILSQNTSDINSDRAYLQLRATYPSWDEVADADPVEIAPVIRSGGLADQKAATIVRVLLELRERHGSLELETLDEIGDDELLDELTSLKGIGLKSAAYVMMFSLGRDLCAVDTHIHRVSNRIGIVETSNAEKTFRQLRPLLPEKRGVEFHVAMIRFGRSICRAQRPRCSECPLYDLCGWSQKETW